VDFPRLPCVALTVQRIGKEFDAVSHRLTHKAYCLPDSVPHGPITAELQSLVALFYETPGELGEFNAVAASSLAQPYRELLAHPHHMTVTVERFHNSPVDVRVLNTKVEGDRYSRQILLSRQSDGRIVQFGIVRLNFEFLSPEVRQEIERQSTPLGRILIANNVMREIELVAVWRVKPGPDLCKLFDCNSGEITYGRTAIIHCNGDPAVELLEIVTPVHP
jgi:chorismate-pyruvate lyase